MTVNLTGIVPPLNGGTGIANANAATVTSSGNYAYTRTLTGTTNVTFPTSGTLYGTATGSITSSQLSTSLTDETGSGAAVFGTSPSLTTPSLAGEVFSTNAGVSAAGTTLAGATALTSDYNVITTAAANSGVALPTATMGRKAVIVNKGANAVNVYPAAVVGSSIDALAVNTAITIPVNGWMEFNASSITQWYSSSNITFASGSAVTSFSTGTTGFTPSSASTGAVTLGGILNTANGGMGASMTAGAIGAIPYASSTTAYTTLPAAAAGSVLTSNGTGTAPSWTSNNGLNWALSGNSGITVPPAPTTYGTTAITGNFLGTTGGTAADLVFATTNATTTLERMRVMSSGKVGIGTAAPSYNLDVTNSTAASVTNIGITSGSSTGTTSANVTGIKFNDWFQSTKLTSEITFDYQGSGLNAYSPAPSVQNASHGLNFISGRSGYDNFMFRDASNNVVGGFINSGYGATLTSMSTTDNFVVGGKVGIGLTAPLAPLMVYNGISNSLSTANVGTAVAVFDGGSGTANSRVVIGSNWTATGTRPESVLEFWNNATGGGEGEGASISTSSAQASGTGNISTSLIFSTSNIAAAPTARMQLWNHVTDAVLSLLPSSTGNWARIGSNTHPMAFLTAGSDNSSTTPAMYINTSGQVGINTTSPSSLLYTLSADNSYTTNIATFMAANKTYGVAIAYGGIRPVGTNSSNALLLDGQGGGSVNLQSQQSGNVVIGDATNNSSPYLLPASSTSLRIGSSTAQCQDIYSNYFYALGKIMIGSTSSPGFPLDIENYITGYTTPNASYAYGQSGQGPNGSVSSTSQYVSIYAVQNVVGKSFIGFSDARLKNIIGQSKTAEDLNLLRQVKVTDYTMRDLIQNGLEHHKKLIAQELKEVYPIAVKTIPVPQFIPNIYCNAESFEIKGKELTINMSKAVSDTNIKVGVRCKLYVSDTTGVEKEIKGKVSAFTSTQLQITTEDVLKRSELSERLFVYGTEINDLLAVDYEEVSMLNVSATQELAKKLAGAEEHIQLLMAENDKLKTTSTQQADLMKTMKAQLDAITERLNITTSVR